MIARERFPFEIDGDLGLSQQQRQGKFQISDLRVKKQHSQIHSSIALQITNTDANENADPLRAACNFLLF